MFKITNRKSNVSHRYAYTIIKSTTGVLNALSLNSGVSCDYENKIS